MSVGPKRNVYQKYTIGGCYFADGNMEDDSVEHKIEAISVPGKRLGESSTTITPVMLHGQIL